MQMAGGRKKGRTKQLQQKKNCSVAAVMGKKEEKEKKAVNHSWITE